MLTPEAFEAYLLRRSAFRKIGAIGHAPHCGHFTSRLSISIIASAPRTRAPSSAKT